MRKVFISIGFVLLFSVLFSSCSDFCIFTDIPLGSDVETIENILDSNKMEYKCFEASSFLGPVNLDDSEQIADLIINQNADYLGEMLYKDYLYFFSKICSMDFETSIYFFKGQCSNITLFWHLKTNPSMKNGYVAADKIVSFIKQQFPELEFTAEGNLPGWKSLYSMNISDTVSITVEVDQETILCKIEDSELQKKYNDLRESVDLIVKNRTMEE